MNPADTAWIIVATALVLFMTLPGLALFYGGLGAWSQRVVRLYAMFHCLSYERSLAGIWLFHRLWFRRRWPVGRIGQSIFDGCDNRQPFWHPARGFVFAFK